MRYKDAKEFIQNLRWQKDDKCPDCGMRLELVQSHINGNWWVRCPDVNCGWEFDE